MPKHTGKLAVICFTLMFIVLYALLTVNGLAQNSFTPYIWLESKHVEWNGRWYDYYVEGWWFEETRYSHMGDWREFQTTFSVYSTILEPWVDGNTARICILEVNRQAIVVDYFCWPSFQSFLPYVE